MQDRKEQLKAVTTKFTNLDHKKHEALRRAMEVIKAARKLKTTPSK